MNVQPPEFAVSVIILNWNAARWIPRCLASLREQTIFSKIEVIFADNASGDDSEKVARECLAGWPNGYFLQNGGNFGYGGGSNRGAARAKGKYLFFLNTDIWLEPTCLEEIVKHTEANKSKISCPLVMDYDSNNIQTRGESGFDIFGCLVSPRADEKLEQPFTVATFFFIDREFFQKIGRFDEESFLYNEEMDLSWRAWIAGGVITPARSAIMHHFAPSTGDSNSHIRTSESKRFYTNRSQLLTTLKSAQGLLLLIALNQIALFFAEAVVVAISIRRLSFIDAALIKPVKDCWRLRRHIFTERRRIGSFRQRGDLWIFGRFFRFSLGRWGDAKRFFKGNIQVDPAKRTPLKTAN
jgi:GT2 family glycosyltransferase